VNERNYVFLNIVLRLIVVLQECSLKAVASSYRRSTRADSISSAEDEVRGRVREQLSSMGYGGPSCDSVLGSEPWNGKEGLDAIVSRCIDKLSKD
jgi:hypothetical protein